MCGTETLFTTLGVSPRAFCRRWLWLNVELYYATAEFKTLIQSLGGEYNDPKRRPMVCLVKSTEDPCLYWAIPMGNLGHRTDEQQQHILFMLFLPAFPIPVSPFQPPAILQSNVSSSSELPVRIRWRYNNPYFLVCQYDFIYFKSYI